MKEETIFSTALGIADPNQRAAFLDQVCAGNEALRHRMDNLLRGYEEAGSFLQVPALERELRQRPEGLKTKERMPTQSDAPDGTPKGESASDNWLTLLEPCNTLGRLGKLADYEILELIGRGGMGVVLRADDTKLDRVVAVKMLAPQLATNATARKRFVREAKAAAAVTHDHVVTIHAIEESNEVPFLVLEYVEGRSLQECIDAAGSQKLADILRIGKQIAAGLASAHKHGLVHRDIKPSNILLENLVERVKITDFGLARAIDDTSITQSGEVSGSPQYMSPEQAEAGCIDHRSDLFSLGSVLYALCTGAPPFRASTSLGVLKRVCEETPRPIREINPDIPEWLVAIIDKLMAKKPADRYQSAGEVAELLGEHLARVQQPSQFPRPATTSELEPPHRRRNAWLVAAAILLLMVSGFGLTEATGVTNVRQFVGTIMRIHTPEGALVVEVNDPNVKVLVDGKELVVTGAGPKEVRVKLGKRVVEARKDGKVILRKIVEITRKGRPVVTVSGEFRTIPVPKESGTNGRTMWKEVKPPPIPSWKLLTSDEWQWSPAIRLAPPLNISKSEALSRKVIAWHEGGAWLSPDQLTMFFHTDRDGGPSAERRGRSGSDLWMSTRKSIHQPWLAPICVHSVSTKYFESDPSVSADGRILVFASRRPGGIGTWNIWMSERESASQPWSRPVILGHPVNSQYDEQYPALSPDGLSLFFASERPGGQGGYDLWMSTRKSRSDAWTQVVNLGPDINSASWDADPYLAYDGLSLLFSSQRPGGQGGGDLWLSTRKSTEDPWTPAMNLGKAVNTSAHEETPFLSADGESLYFSAPGRAKGDWNYDIWMVQRIAKKK